MFETELDAINTTDPRFIASITNLYRCSKYY